MGNDCRLTLKRDGSYQSRCQQGTGRVETTHGVLRTRQQQNVLHATHNRLI